MKIYIRLANDSDVEQVNKLLLNCNEQLGYDDNSFVSVYTRINVGQCFVAEDVELSDKKIVGCVGYELSKIFVDICDLVVVPEYRRNHIASCLIKKVFLDARQTLKNNFDVRIGAYETNTIANEFYSKIGVKLFENKNEGSIIYKIDEKRVI